MLLVICGTFSSSNLELVSVRPRYKSIFVGHKLKPNFLKLNSRLCRLKPNKFCSIGLHLPTCCLAITREHSPLVEISLYGCSIVLLIWTELVHNIPQTTNHIFSFLVKSNLVKMETVILTPTLSLL